MDRLSSLALPSPEPDADARYTVPLDVARSLVGLALAVNHGLETEQQDVYGFALRDLPIQLIRRACLTLAKTATFWPKVSEIRACVEALTREDTAQESAKRLMPAPVVTEDREPRFFCLDCYDEPAGWRLWWCQGRGDLRETEIPRHAERMGHAACGRLPRHSPHTYVEHCACFDVNPVAAAARRKMAESHTKRQPARATRAGRA